MKVMNDLNWIKSDGKSGMDYCVYSSDGAVSAIQVKNTLLIGGCRIVIWVNQPIHLFLVGCLNPCLQGTNVRVGLPQPRIVGSRCNFPVYLCPSSSSKSSKVTPRRYGVEILSNSDVPVPNFMAFPCCTIYLWSIGIWLCTCLHQLNNIVDYY